MSLQTSTTPIPLSSDPDGTMRVGHTRVTLDTVVTAFGEGATAEEIVQQYPTLKLADVYHVLGYFLEHQSEVDEYLRQRQTIAQEVRELNESRFDPNGVRERLLSRRTQ